MGVVALKMQGPMIAVKARGIAAVPPKRADPYYFSKEWKELSRQAMERDGYMCTVPGCGKRAKVPDHIVPRRWGGADTLGNIRCLCDDHDRKFKERPNGSRKKMAMGRGFEKPKAAL
jgi:5-methylcytosine-specific restriction protein A